MALVVNIYFLIFITRQWSGESNVFSLIWSSAHGGEGSLYGAWAPGPPSLQGQGPSPSTPLYRIPPLALYRTLPPSHVQTCLAWTSLYSPPPDTFKIVHCKGRTVEKPAVGTRLKYLLVC